MNSARGIVAAASGGVARLFTRHRRWRRVEPRAAAGEQYGAGGSRSAPSLLHSPEMSSDDLQKKRRQTNTKHKQTKSRFRLPLPSFQNLQFFGFKAETSQYFRSSSPLFGSAFSFLFWHPLLPCFR